MPVDLADKVMVITGASAGIGAATAIQCAEAGMDLVINARRSDRLESVAQRIQQIGRRVECVVGDVTDKNLSERLLDVAESRFGGFYAVFANAGVGLDKSAIETHEHDLRRIFEVNFFASVELIQTAARRLIEAERPGHLLMCSSSIAKFTIPRHSAYSATKAAQNHVCRAMRIELAHEHINVSSVHPITTDTEFFDVSAKRSDRPPGASRSIDRVPRMYVQSSQRVARAIVKCLRRPHPEVWTSFTVRLAAALFTFSPRLCDLMMRTQKRT
jgi:short-subunit dehydrogenase